jgi:hypothetical protein
MDTTSQAGTRCSYPLVGVDALGERLRRTAAELAREVDVWSRTFSFGARQRAARLEVELSTLVSAYSLVTGVPETDVPALLAA